MSYKLVSPEYKNSQILLSLYHSNKRKQNILVHPTISSLDVQKQNRFSHQHFRARSKRTLFYRMTFFGIGAFFLLLCLMVYFHTASAMCGVFFQNCQTPKMMLYGICFFFSCFAFFLGYSIQTEKETIIHLAKKASYKLKRKYRQKLSEVALHDYISFDMQYKINHVIKLAYQEAWEKIKECKKEALLFTTSLSYKSRKERTDLFTQIILEYTEQIDAIVEQFKERTDRFYP